MDTVGIADAVLTATVLALCMRLVRVPGRVAALEQAARDGGHVELPGRVAALEQDRGNYVRRVGTRDDPGFRAHELLVRDLRRDVDDLQSDRVRGADVQRLEESIVALRTAHQTDHAEEMAAIRAMHDRIDRLLAAGSRP